MLAMLLVIVVGGIVAAKVIPDTVTVQQRQDEKGLQYNLGAIRMAIAMERTASMTPRFGDDWNNRALFLGYLDELMQRNLLSRIPVDPNIPHFQWGTNPAKTFWIPTQNFLASASFEVKVLNQTPWATGSANVVASISFSQWPGRLDGDVLKFQDGRIMPERQIESFHSENPFGRILGTSGASLLIIQP